MSGGNVIMSNGIDVNVEEPMLPSLDSVEWEECILEDPEPINY